MGKGSRIKKGKKTKNPQVRSATIKRSTPGKVNYAYLGIILVLTIAVYSNGLTGEFTNWDDDLYITENSLITELSFDNIGDYFTTDIAGNFHPLTMISLGLDYKMAGLNPTLYHVKNLFFHLLNCLLVFFFIYRLSNGNQLVAFFTALVFGVHAMHVESVAWISERKDVLYTFYFLAGLLLYYKYLDTRKPRYFIFTCLVFVLSCLAKSAAVVFPIVLFLIDYFENRKLDVKSVLEKIPIIGFSVFIGLKALNTQAASNALGDFEYFSFLEKMQFASYGFFNYIIKFIVPYNLSAFHPYPKADDLSPVYIVSLIAMIGLLSFMVFIGRKHKQLLFGMLFYAVTIALVLQFVTVGNAIIAERYTYLPYVGLAFVAFFYLDKLYQRQKNTGKQIIRAGVGIYIVFISVTTFIHTKTYANTAALWDKVISIYPDDSGSYSNRGQYYRVIGERDKALADYNKAISIDVKNHNAYSNRGKIFYDAGRYDEAFSDYSTALNINDKNKDALNGMAAVYFTRKDYEKTLKYLSEALVLDPTNPEFIKNRGLTYHTITRYNEAINDFNAYLSLNPNDASILNSVGLCYSGLNRPNDAIPYYTKAISINSKGGAFFFNRSREYYKLGNLQNAMSDAVQAQNLGTQVSQEYLNQLRGL